MKNSKTFAFNNGINKRKALKKRENEKTQVRHTVVEQEDMCVCFVCASLWQGS